MLAVHPPAMVDTLVKGSMRSCMPTCAEEERLCPEQEAVAWLVERDIVRALLRAHLHQRQYMDQVQKVLKTLASEGGLQADHLELLWALTEKVGRFCFCLRLCMAATLPASAHAYSIAFQYCIAYIAAKSGQALMTSATPQVRWSDRHSGATSAQRCQGRSQARRTGRRPSSEGWPEDGACMQVDTFEAVKNNVYSVLGDLAKDLAGPELDLLFSKFEACVGWPAPDALKAMDLLKQLAKSDATVTTAP